MEGLKKKTKVVEFIVSKYGELNEENLKRFFLSDFYISSSSKFMPESAYDDFKYELDRLLEFQNLTYEDLMFLGAGQTFSGLLVGDAVMKLGTKSYPIFNLPYRLNPIYKKELQGNVDLFVSRAADTSKITEKDVQNMYNRIRADGGIWLDVKDENLGRVSNSKYKFEELYKNDGLYEGDNYNVNFKPYDGEIYLIDYEDVVFITPEIKAQILAYEPVNINSIKREIVRDNSDPNQMYFYGYIVNSNKLLDYEARYQRSIGNEEKAEECVEKRKQNDKAYLQREYEMEQVYRHGRYLGEVGKKYSIKEIAIRATQNTSFSRFKSIVNEVRDNMFSIYYSIIGKNNNLENNTNDSRNDVDKLDEFDSFEISEFKRKLDEELDPYTTR